ncbi:hypothetical protein [Sphingobium xenophagum]
MMLLLAAPAAQSVEWAQLTIERRVIVRVPMASKGKVPPPVSPDTAKDWDEKKGPRCIALRSIRAASIIVLNGVDLILADQHRYRARLEKGCDSAGFYSGFYVEPHADGSLCSGRDELQARSGMSCAIDSFRRLVAADD